MIAFKFLDAEGRAPFSQRSWPLPSGDDPGAWIDANPGPLVPCRNGIHACAQDQLPYWLGVELWEVELGGTLLRATDSLIARRGRLLRPIERWRDDGAHAFALACLGRAQTFITGMTGEHAASGAQYLQVAGTALEAHDHPRVAYACALAFTVLADSAETAYRAERAEQARVLAEILAR